MLGVSYGGVFLIQNEDDFENFSRSNRIRGGRHGVVGSMPVDGFVFFPGIHFGGGIALHWGGGGGTLILQACGLNMSPVGGVTGYAGRCMEPTRVGHIWGRFGLGKKI